MINFLAFLCFILSTYAVFSNDVVQSLGTFINVNSKKPAWILWLFISVILVATIFGAYYTTGDITFGRLEHIADVAETHWWFLIPPIVLILLAILGISASTTFLILSVFASGLVIQDMIIKSVLGYFVGISLSLCVYAILNKIESNFRKIKPVWWEHILFWISTAFLWVAWITQNNANMFVFLPRCLTLTELIIATSIMVLSVGLVVKNRGGKIQKIIQHKSNARDVRSATIINLLFGSILITFLFLSSIPLSTTWVFIGVLAGREIMLRKYLKKSRNNVLKNILYDLTVVTIGLVVSILVAKLILSL